MSFTACEGLIAAQDILNSLDENDPILLLVGLGRPWKTVKMPGPNRCYIMALGIIAKIHKVEEGQEQEKLARQDENQEDVLLPKMTSLKI